MGGKRIDKHCECCGTLMVNVDPARRFCLECTKKRRNEYQREHQREYNREYHKNYYKNRQKKANEFPSMYAVNPNKKYCKGCVYWGGAYENNFCCNYIFVEKHRRPCPPGKDCTEKVTGKRKYAMDFVTDCGVRG
jgi:hypothetical protein